MLKKIIIKNVNSIGECVIDFEKGNYRYLEDNVEGDIVNPLAFYGHNGSGKSSVFVAMAYLINLMVEPAESLLPFVVNHFLYEEYRVGKKKDKNLITGSIELHFELGDSSYEYFIATSSLRQIEKEYLKKDGVIILTRGLDEYTYNGKRFSYDNMSKLIPSLRLLASMEIGDETIQTVYSYISAFTFVNLPFINNGGFVTSKLFKNTNIFDLLANHSAEVREILKDYDEFPIYTIKKNSSSDPFGNPINQYSLILEGEGFKGNLPFQMISAGMKNQSLLLSILAVMPRNGVLFVDELESALHPSAIRSFLKVVKAKGVQLVFSSHNTNILQILRPDQIYFAKWKKGKSKYCRLSKVYPNVREINNIEKMYLGSVFDEAIDNG